MADQVPLVRLKMSENFARVASCRTALTTGSRTLDAMLCWYRTCAVRKSRTPGNPNAGLANVAANGRVGTGFDESFGSRSGQNGRYTMSNDTV